MMHRAPEIVKTKDGERAYSLSSSRIGANPFRIVFSLTLTGFMN